MSKSPAQRIKDSSAIGAGGSILGGWLQGRQTTRAQIRAQRHERLLSLYQPLMPDIDEALTAISMATEMVVGGVNEYANVMTANRYVQQADEAVTRIVRCSKALILDDERHANRVHVLTAIFQEKFEDYKNDFASVMQGKEPPEILEAARKAIYDSGLELVNAIRTHFAWAEAKG